MVVMPLLVTILFCVMAMVVTWSDKYRTTDKLEARGVSLSVTVGGKEREQGTIVDDDETVKTSNKQENLVLNELTTGASADNATNNENATINENATTEKNEHFWFSGVYLAAAWLASIFYALSSLYNDRRDKSILYWKTMPVPELHTVIIKLLFAIVGFSAIAIAVSWLAGAVLMGYAQLVFPPEMLADDTAGMSFSKVVVWPILAVITAVFWCAPVYALVLYISARARKLPILLLIIPIIVVRILEGMVFHTQHIYDFLNAHSPLTLLARFSEMESAGQFLNTYWVNSFGSMALGLLMAALLVWAAAWRREHHFDV